MPFFRIRISSIIKSMDYSLISGKFSSIHSSELEIYIFFLTDFCTLKRVYAQILFYEENSAKWPYFTLIKVETHLKYASISSRLKDASLKKRKINFCHFNPTFSLKNYPLWLPYLKYLDFFEKYVAISENNYSCSLS